MNDNQRAWYRITIDHFFADVSEIQRAAAFEQFMGDAAIAQAMGPDKDLGLKIGDTTEGLLCQRCALTEDMPLAQLLERMAEAEDSKS